MFDDLRSAWGAAKAKNAPTYVDPQRRTEFFVHYDGGSAINVSNHADCLARVKQDQAFHMNSNGWSDIGYNGLVCQHGRAIEGRGIDYVGAHCPDHNTTGYGFQFMVGGSQAPTEAAKARMRRLYDDCCAHSKATLLKRGHRDGFATACPGDQIYAWVKAGMPAPAVVATQEEDMAATEADAVVLFTQATPFKNALAPNPDTAARVSAGYLIEGAAKIAKDTNADLAAVASAVAALKAQVAALPASQPAVTDEQLERVLRKVIGSVDGV